MFAFFEGVSNLYILTAATIILAVIIARLCAKCVEKKNTSQSSKLDSKNEDLNDDASESDSDHECTEGLVSKLKSARLKELEGALTVDQLEEEKRVEREQLSAIFELLKRQEAELNVKEIDESELTAQLGLYR